MKTWLSAEMKGQVDVVPKRKGWPEVWGADKVDICPNVVIYLDTCLFIVTYVLTVSQIIFRSGAPL